MVNLFNLDEDLEAQQEFISTYIALQERINQFYLKLFLNGKYDTGNAIFALYAGAGGKDAQDWTQMLLRMYLRFCEKKGWETTILDQSFGEETGIKSVVVAVKGNLAYGYLKCEKGVHRLVRLSPFNSKHTRETSFALLEVFPEIIEDNEVNIKPEEIRIDVFCSGGAGGQHVNRTASAVRITHLPTGIVVQCQNERSQIQNRAVAMKILRAKIFAKIQDQRENQKKELQGGVTEATWGNQIRSYVLHPYKMVKDHRTNLESSNPEKVLTGDLDDFIEAYLRNV